MKTSKIVEAMGYIDDDLITASIDYKPRKIRMKWIPYAAAAACAACLCIFAVRFSNYDPPVNLGSVDYGNNANAGSASSASTPPASESSGNTIGANTSNTSGDTISSSGDPANSSEKNPSSSNPGDPVASSGEKPGSSKPVYDDVYKGVNRNYVMGSPLSYDEIADYLTNDPGHPEWDTDSLYLVETIKALSLDECKALADWDGMYSMETTYKVRVLKDLISGETVDRTENILISMGCVEWQNKGDPIYAPGERFTVVLTKPYEGCDFLRTPAAFAFRYDAVEEDGEIMLYSRRSDLDALNMPTSVNIEESVITSTTKNPAIYSQKLTLTAFADYFREDFKKRGLTSHFDNAQLGNSSENDQDNRNARQAVPTEDKPPVVSSPNAYLSTRSATFSEAKEQVRFVDVKEVSGADFVGYELDYVMPSETLFALNYVYTDGSVSVSDNSGDWGGKIVISPGQWYEKIERDGMVFWKDLITDPHAAIYISESDIAYFGMFESDADLSKAIDTIRSLI